MTKLSDPMAVVALVNAMIGGTILVLPILAIKTGYLLIPVIALIMGLSSLFTCQLVLKHLGKRSTVNQALSDHFNNQRFYVIFYNIVIGLSIIALLILYFNLLVKQILGLMGIKQGFASGFQITLQTYLPYVISIVLFILVLIMRKFEFGSTLLAYGIVSIIGFCLFLVWVYATSPSSVPGTHPPIVNHIPPVHHLFVDFMASLSMACAIHQFVIPILNDNPNKQNHLLLLRISYYIGIAIYTFIGYSCFAIINRAVSGQPQTIQDYFIDENGHSTWPIYVIQVLYAIHLFSAFPQFLMVAKLRLFSIYNTIFVDLQILRPVNNQGQNQNYENNNGQSHEEQISKTQLLFYFFFIGLCCMLKVLGVKLAVIIELNGAVLCFLYVYMMPIVMHVKCIYFKDGFNLNFLRNLFNPSVQKAQKLQIQQIKQQQSEIVCSCYVQYCKKQTKQKVLQGIILFLMMGMGLFIMVYTLYTMFAETGQHK